jgi:hypothetical protein
MSPNKSNHPKPNGFLQKQRRKNNERGAMGYGLEQVMTHEAKGAKKQQPWMTPKKKNKLINT